MSQWVSINDSNERYRLLCDDKECSLSIANLLTGKLHITTVHGKQRHSYTCSNKDMVFIFTEFFKSLSPQNKKKLLDFYQQF